MSNEEILLFIGNCLGMRHHPDRIPGIKTVLESESVPWEKLVWFSSYHRVLPALYVQLRDSQLIDSIPPDLKAHMEQLHKINTLRNAQILNQVDELIPALNARNLSPIFLKGVAHTLDGLYADPGERMIVDIDFLLAEREIPIAIEVMQELGYSYLEPILVSLSLKHRHFPRLIRGDDVAGIEIHRQPVSKPFDRKFNFDLIFPEKRKLSHQGECYRLSDRHQVIHNQMNAQMNDGCYRLRRIDLRHCYDLFLLSKRANPLDASNQFAHYFRQLNAHIVVSYHMLNKPASLVHKNHHPGNRYLRIVLFCIRDPRWYKRYKICILLKDRILAYSKILILGLNHSDVRKRIRLRLSDPAWYSRQMASLRNC